MTTINLILNLVSLILIGGIIWYLCMHTNQKKITREVMVVPPIKISKEEIVEIVDEGEVLSGSIIEDQQLEMDEKPVEVREWENEQRSLRRRNQSES